jgi:hypothetical protein
MKKAHTISQTRRYLLLGLIALCLPVVVIAIGLEIGGYLPSLIYTEPQANKHDGPSTDLDQRERSCGLHWNANISNSLRTKSELTLMAST